MRGVQLILVVGVLAILALNLGCRSAEERDIYTSAEPGPWQDVQVNTIFDGHRMTIAVVNFPTTPRNYVRSFTLFNQGGFEIGRRVFDPLDEPTETFILTNETREVSVTVVSTGQGKWRTHSLPVPAIPAERRTLPEFERPIPPQ